MKKKISLIVALVCLVASLACAGIMSFAGNNESNLLTVYYPGTDKAYIHYQIGDGEWTDAPGVNMERSNDVAGCTFKYTIDLGSADTATVCFNDGRGNWDNNNYKNYNLKAGTYVCRRGMVMPYDESKLNAFVDTSNITPSYFTCYVPIYVFGGDAPYKLEYKFTTPNRPNLSPFEKSGKVDLMGEGNGGHSASYTAMVDCRSNGNCDLYVKVTDANGKVFEETFKYKVPGFEVTKIIPSLSSPQKIGTNISLRSEYINAFESKYESYSDRKETYTITKKGSDDSVVLERDPISGRDAIWAPTEPGEYTISVSVTDTSEQVATYSIDYVIEDTDDNLVIVYYNGFYKPYIHYAVNGNWTTAPGQKMAECRDVDGYGYKAVINVGKAESITACFTDGNGKWDNNESQNYQFFIGNNYHSNYIK